MAETKLIFDRLTWVAPLGVRFWDPITQSLVSDGLVVTAIPRVNNLYPGQPACAFPNRSGVFAFHHLPGLMESEIGAGDLEYWEHLPAPKEFVISVTDTRKRFLPFQIKVNAPHQGIYAWECATSHPAPGSHQG